jgi:4-hydroxy-tetrahydrodipicolinate reductase
MNILLLGHGKTGSLVAEVARQRGHDVQVWRSADNPEGSGLTAEALAAIDAVIDFTAPQAVLANIRACLQAGKPMVVGTTGWYEYLPEVRELVTRTGTGMVYAANFSVGVNLFFEIVRTASGALEHGYFGQIFERHHAQKKDAPSGTALTLRSVLGEGADQRVEITSFREGDVVGQHELLLDSPADTIYLCHDAKSRRGFAAGAVRAAEWIPSQRGCFDFRDIWRQL